METRLPLNASADRNVGQAANIRRFYRDLRFDFLHKSGEMTPAVVRIIGNLSLKNSVVEVVIDQKAKH